MATPPMSERTSRLTQTQLMAAVSVMQVVITLIVAPLATWGLARIVDYGERIGKIESTRFTAEDARSLIESITSAYKHDQSAIDARLRNIERQMDRVLVKLGENPKAGE